MYCGRCGGEIYRGDEHTQEECDKNNFHGNVLLALIFAVVVLIAFLSR